MVTRQGKGSVGLILCLSEIIFEVSEYLQSYGMCLMASVASNADD